METYYNPEDLAKFGTIVNAALMICAIIKE